MSEADSPGDQLVYRVPDLGLGACLSLVMVSNGEKAQRLVSRHVYIRPSCQPFNKQDIICPFKNRNAQKTMQENLNPQREVF